VLHNASLARKVVAGFFALIVILATLGFFSLRSASILAGALDRAIHTTATKLDRVGALDASFHELASRAKSTHLQYVIRHFEAKSDNQTCSVCHGDDTIQTAVDGFHGALADTRTRIAAVRDVGVTQAEGAALDEVANRVNEWDSLYTEYLQRASKGDFEGAHEIITQKMYPTISEVDKLAATLKAGQKAALRQADSETASVIARSRWTVISVILAGVVVSIVALLVLRRACRSLKDSIRTIGRGAAQLAEAAAQVSDRSQKLASGTSRQHAALERTFESGSAANEAAARNATHAGSAAEIVEGLHQDTTSAERTLAGMKEVMSGITVASEKVSGIARLIDEVAFQTNMLALNAAVEAARAGEAGAGFSVVAEEVRNLAQKCAAAAKDASDLIEQAITRARTGSAELNKASAAVAKVVQNVARVAAIAAEVRTESQEQARSVGSISSALEEVQAATREAADNAQSGAQAGEELSAQSAEMRETVAELTRLVG
jgi:methyl-accepting chemotaxis protein